MLFATEQLEDRNLLACTVFGASNPQLIIEGDSNDNIIEVASDHAIVDGIRIEIEECYDRIRILPGLGHDTVKIKDQVFEDAVTILGHNEGRLSVHISNSEFSSTVTLGGGDSDDSFSVTGSSFSWLVINGYSGFDSTRLVDVTAERIKMNNAGKDNLTLLLNVETDTLSIVPMSGSHYAYKPAGGRVAMINVDVTSQAIVNGGRNVDMFGFLNCDMNILHMNSGGSTDIIVAINHSGEVRRHYDPHDVVREA